MSNNEAVAEDVVVEAADPAIVDSIQIDPQLLHQTIMNKNARLIAMLVHENAVLEVAVEQERRNSAEARAKYESLKAAQN